MSKAAGTPRVAKREEELGIAGVPLAEHGQFYFEDKIAVSAGARCSARLSRSLRFLQEDEASEVWLLTPEEITARSNSSL